MIRILDVVISLISLVILSPFLIPLVIILKFTGEHQVLYLQKRVGKHWKEFRIIKFATMLINSPNLPGGLLTNKNDPRVLPFGRILRKTKVNELPQLINILMGHMSLVGPRPQEIRHFSLYSKEIQEKIVSVRPGLTGIGSVVFRDEERFFENEIDHGKQFYERVIVPYKGQLELWWIANMSLKNYLKILILTAYSLGNYRDMLWLKWFENIPEMPKELQERYGK